MEFVEIEINGQKIRVAKEDEVGIRKMLTDAAEVTKKNSKTIEDAQATIDDLTKKLTEHSADKEIGRASCRERV